MEKVEKVCTFCGNKMRVPMDDDKIFRITCQKCACDFYVVGFNVWCLYLINNQRSAIKRYKIRCLNCNNEMAVPMKVEMIHECNCSEESRAFYMGRFDSKGKFWGRVFVANIHSDPSNVNPNIKRGPFLLLKCGNSPEFVFNGGYGNGTFFKYEYYEDNGEITKTEIDFKNGMKNGTYIEESTRGSKEVRNFVNDKINGLLEVFWSGRKESYSYYNDGQLISRGDNFHGIWKKESNYSNGRRNHQFELFKDHTESNKIGFGNFVDHKLYGHCQVLIEGTTGDGLSRFLEGYFNGKCIERIRVVDEFGRVIDDVGNVTFII